MRRLTARQSDILRRLSVPGATQLGVANDLGVPLYSVGNIVRALRRRGLLPPGRRIGHVGKLREVPESPRCHCGLRLPCEHPVGLADFATRGLGEWT